MTPDDLSLADEYPLPVSRLLSYGDCNEMNFRTWPDYVNELGFTEEHIPDLIRLMTDERLWHADAGMDSWGVVHAWRSLAQLQTLALIDPLLQLWEQYDDDDWLLSESAKVLVHLGEAALPTLTAYMADTTRSEATRFCLAEAITDLANDKPELRPACIDALTTQLKAYAANGKGVNGMIVAGLVEMNVVEAAPIMEQAFLANQVDDSIPGTWPRIQVNFGLKSESDFSPKDFQPKFFKNLQAARLLANPDLADSRKSSYEPDGWDYGPVMPPPKFGEGMLSIPKQGSDRPVRGFGSAKSQPKKKKGKK